MLEEGPDWQPGEKEEAFGPCLQAIPLEGALRRVGRPRTDIVPDKNEAISWERTPLEIFSLQKEDESIARVFYWTELDGESGDMPSLGTNLIPKEQAIQYGPEVPKWFPKDDSRPVLQTVFPIVGRKEILSPLHSSQTNGGHFAVEKTLARIQQRF